MTTIKRELWKIEDIKKYLRYKHKSSVYELFKLNILTDKCRSRIPGRFIPEIVMQEIEAWNRQNKK